MYNVHILYFLCAIQCIIMENYMADGHIFLMNCYINHSTCTPPPPLLLYLIIPLILVQVDRLPLFPSSPTLTHPGPLHPVPSHPFTCVPRYETVKPA